MKKIIILFAMVLTPVLAFSQNFELKTSPVLIPFNIWQLSGEYLITEDFGLEPGIIFAGDELDGMAFILGKYYFNPKAGNDGINLGMFLNIIFSDFDPGIGFYTGYKWISRKGVTFELGFGVGRTISSFGSGYGSEVTGIGQASLGYRFGYYKKNK